MSHRQVNANYDAVLLRVKAAKTVIVLFLVKENAKWGVNSLYKAFECDPLFDPMVAVIYPELPVTPDALQLEGFQKNYDFFKSKGMRVFKAYDEEKNEFLDLRTFSPDIVFFESPWQWPVMYDIQSVSQFALTCYIPYGVSLPNSPAGYRLLFLQLLWRQFVESEFVAEYFSARNINKGKNIKTFGYPKLDVYLEDKPVDSESLWSVSVTKRSAVKRIIYAPHWSFRYFYYATLDWNGEFLLDYAKSHPETDWIFKPHPRLRYSLCNELGWDEQWVDEYFSAWDALPNAKVFDEGDYFDYFCSSDALITDSVSFLAEYLYTRNPIIHLINPQSVGYNPVGERLVKDYYKAHNKEELGQLLDRVVLGGDDYLYEKRMDALNVIPLNPNGAGNAIKDYLKDAIFQTE